MNYKNTKVSAAILFRSNEREICFALENKHRPTYDILGLDKTGCFEGFD